MRPSCGWSQSGVGALHHQVADNPQGPCSPAQSQQFHTCPEGQAGVATVDATEGFAHKLHNAVDLGLDVSEADVGEWVAVLVNVNGTCGEKCRVSIPLPPPPPTPPPMDSRALLSQHPWPRLLTPHTAPAPVDVRHCANSVRGRIKHLHHKALHTSFKKTKQTTSFADHDSESRNTCSHILLEESQMPQECPQVISLLLTPEFKTATERLTARQFLSTTKLKAGMTDRPFQPITPLMAEE